MGVWGVNCPPSVGVIFMAFDWWSFMVSCRVSFIGDMFLSNFYPGIWCLGQLSLRHVLAAWFGVAEECKSECINDSRCRGIEYSNGRCEVWIREAGCPVRGPRQIFVFFGRTLWIHSLLYYLQLQLYSGVTAADIVIPSGLAYRDRLESWHPSLWTASVATDMASWHCKIGS